MVGDNRLGNCCANSVDLCCDTSPLHSNADVQTGEFVLTDNEDRLEDFQAKRFRFNIFNGLPIDLDQTTTLLGKSDSGSRLLPVVGEGGELGYSVVDYIILTELFALTFQRPEPIEMAPFSCVETKPCLLRVRGGRR